MERELNNRLHAALILGITSTVGSRMLPIVLMNVGFKRHIVLSPNLRRGLKQNFVAKSGILGFLILFGRFLYEEKY